MVSKVVPANRRVFDLYYIQGRKFKIPVPPKKKKKTLILLKLCFMRNKVPRLPINMYWTANAMLLACFPSFKTCSSKCKQPVWRYYWRISSSRIKSYHCNPTRVDWGITNTQKNWRQGDCPILLQNEKQVLKTRSNT